MRKDNKLFVIMLCAAAFLHGGALFLVPDFSRRELRETRNQKPLSIALQFSPAALPAPPAAERPDSPRPEPVVESKDLSERVETETAEGRTEDAPAMTETTGGLLNFSGDDPDPQARQNLILQYQGIIRSMIDKRKEYPYQARRQEQEGKVEVHFVLSRQGLLVGEPSLNRKSRYERLNVSALAAVKSASPYPPFPPEIPAEELSFSVTLSFSLTGNTP
jgi:protein TonB